MMKQEPMTKQEPKNEPTIEKKPCLGCYKENSPDARCCGVCYCCCPAENIDREVDKNRCDFCPENFTVYINSGYFKTTSGYGTQNHDDCCCTFTCLPFKLATFFPCALGSIFNHFINHCCSDETRPRNYLF